MIKFNNRENPCHVIDGKEFWFSRSIAIVSTVFALKNNELYVLLQQRGNVADEPLKWGLPCGYLDWDETLWECLIRETYEETTFYHNEYEKYLIFDNNKNPFFIKSNPSENRQNVSLSFVTLYKFNDDISLEKTIENFKATNETLNVKWVKVIDIENDNSLSFNHNKTVLNALTFVFNNIKNENFIKL